MEQTLPSSSISVGHFNSLRRMALSTGTEPYDPWELEVNSPEWPPEGRESMIRGAIKRLIQPRFGMQLKEAKQVVRRMEEEVYNEVNAVPGNIPPKQRLFMYLDLLGARESKYVLSPSEYEEKVKSDPRYVNLRRDTLDFYYFEPLDTESDSEDDSAQQKKPRVEHDDTGMSSRGSPEAVEAILSDKDKLRKVLIQHPKLLEMLQEKLEQQ